MKTVGQKMEREREESRKRMAEKDKLLSKRALQINTLQGMDNSNNKDKITLYLKKILLFYCYVIDMQEVFNSQFD